MRQQNHGDRIFDLCIFSGIIFFSLIVTDVLDTPYIVALLPLATYAVLCALVFIIRCGTVILISILQLIFHPSKPTFPLCQDTPPMYWDPKTKQFYLNGEPVINIINEEDDDK